MPPTTPADYRRHAIALITAVLGGDQSLIGEERSPLGDPVSVPPADFEAFVSAEVTKALGGVTQLVVRLLIYLEDYTDEGVDRLGWLQRAAADVETTQSE